MIMLGNAIRLAALGPALLGTSVRAPGSIAAAGVARAVRAGAQALLGPPAALMQQAATVLDLVPSRAVWSAEGRAHIQLAVMDGPDAGPVAEAVQKSLAALPGVASARADVVMHRAVVRFDQDRVSLDDLTAAVATTERSEGLSGRPTRDRGVRFPGDSRPVSAEAWALAADLVGLAAAVAGRAIRLPALPGSVAALALLVDNQPRLRGLVESRLGTPTADLVLAAANAASLAVTQGAASLVVDSGQRVSAVLAARARRRAFDDLEQDLWAPDRPGRTARLTDRPRPVPVPAGPVERYADRASTGSLLAAGGLLAATGNPDLAGRAVLIGAPKAARAAREGFADGMARGLSRRGVLVRDPAALRRLDRVDTVLVDSRVLHESRPLIIAARALAESWTTEHVWSSGQRLLWDEQELPVPPPRGRSRHRLSLLEGPAPDGEGLVRRVLAEDGEPVGELWLGTELSPYADAVLAAAQEAGLRLVLTADPAAPEMAGRADEIVESSAGLGQQLRRLQAGGSVVALLSADEDALAAADLGLGIVPAAGRVPWGAHVLLGAGLTEVPRLLAAVPRARAISSRGVSSAAAATFLGALLSAVGGPGRRARATFPVTAAAGGALLLGAVTARAVCRRPPPSPVLHTPWHALEADEVLARLSRTEPVSGGVGPGRTWNPVPPPVVALARNVAAELADPLTPVLATGAAASAVIGSPTDALLVGGVLIANALISGAQRLRADRAVRELLAGEQLTACVVGDAGTIAGRAREDQDAGSPTAGTAPPIPAGLLRVGQVVQLGPGDVVPADLRLLHGDRLEIDEASLTGESVAIGKTTGATPGADLPDRTCMAYQGTTVLAGCGRGVVVAVGTATEAGRALNLAGRAGTPTGMQGRLEELTRRGLPVTLLGGAAVTSLALMRGQRLARAIGSGVSVAVAAVPEGLPLVATVAQAGAARRLSRRGVLVRSTRTVEALGRVDTVCFDKTGTLTEGRLRLARLAGPSRQWPPDAPEGRRVLRAAVRACPRPEAGQPVAHATDQAILDAGLADLQPEELLDWTELSELPFQSDRGFSAAIGRTSESVRLVVKGAPEVLLPRCTHQRDDSGKRRLSRDERDRAVALVHELAAEGLRVLAVARRNLSDVLADSAVEQGAPDAEDLTEDLTLLGFVALADIARPKAAPTVAALQSAGLSTVMITGDHPVTARAIAAGLGIPTRRVVTGPEFAALDEEARTRLAGEASVFARVSPEQKLRIIAALQRAGRVVAMTGDGANDAAAIRLADVGIGMAAHGSTSARTAADLVLTEPDLSLLIDALVEGRAMWGRVRGAVAVLLGGNAGEVAFTLAGTALAGRAPLGSRQFLLVNMLTDLLPSMAIAVAPTPSDAAERRRLLAEGPPSLGAPLLRDIAIRGTATGIGSLIAWQIGRVTGTRRRASTMALAALVGTQLGQTLAVGGRNPLVLATGLGSAAVLAALIQLPGVSHFFGCTPLDPLAWAVVVGSAGATTLASVLADQLLPAAAAPTPAAQQAPAVRRRDRGPNSQTVPTAPEERS